MRRWNDANGWLAGRQSHFRRDAQRGLAVVLAAITAVLGAVAGVAAREAAPLIPAAPGSSETVDHAPLDRLLKAYVRVGADGINRVDYARFRAEGLDELKRYLLALQRRSPATLGPAEHAAYFINLYNALTLDVALEHYPIASIKAVRLADPSGEVQDGPWKARLASVAGQRLSLDDIAGKVLRPALMSREPRGHYLLNCLSIGCPNLLPEAITGAKLERQMAAAAAAFVRHPRALTVAGGKAKASSLFDWYAADFGGTAGVIQHMAAVGGAEVAGRLAGVTEFAEYDYDWALADASR